MFLCTLAIAVSAQRSNPRHVYEDAQPRVRVRLGVGLMPTFLKSSTQDMPALSATGEFQLTQRLALGLNYGKTRSTSSAYVDRRGVHSYATSEVDHIGTRATGQIVRNKRLNVYGGVQVGVNFVQQRVAHVFEEAVPIDDQEDYLSHRPSPFGAPGNQLAVVGFIGATIRIASHVGAFAELGNNVSLLTAGVAVSL